MARKPAAYTNESITSLKGADRVRKRPGVIFGSDGVDGCAHSIFEILSNAIDEAREGYGNRILITKFKDGSVEVEDFGRGMPVDYNKNEQRYNWELLFCEMYAGGKYSCLLYTSMRRHGQRRNAADRAHGAGGCFTRQPGDERGNFRARPSRAGL